MKIEYDYCLYLSYLHAEVQGAAQCDGTWCSLAPGASGSHSLISLMSADGLRQKAILITRIDKLFSQEVIHPTRVGFKDLTQEVVLIIRTGKGVDPGFRCV